MTCDESSAELGQRVRAAVAWPFFCYAFVARALDEILTGMGEYIAGGEFDDIY